MARFLLTALGVIILGLAAGTAFLYAPDTDPEEMQAKYGGDLARYAEGEQGLKVHYRDQGCQTCPALVLVHGSSASLHTWEPWVDLLSAEYRIVSLDLPGHGLTGPHPAHDYTARSMVAAVEAVRDEAALSRFALAGNSMGGWVSWNYALDHPDDLTALILVDASGVQVPEKTDEPKGNIGFKLMASPVGRFLGKKLTPRFIIAQSLSQSMYVQEVITEEMIDRYWELLRYPGNREATMIRATMERNLSRAARLPEISTPTLIMWGKEDSLIPVEAAAVFDESLPDSRVVIYDDAGHIPMEEIPAKSAGDVSDFLSEVLSTETE